MNLKNSALFSVIVLTLALVDNGKHMYLAYEMIHPFPKAWEMWTAIASIIVLEAAVLKFTLRGNKELAMYFAISTGLITSVYLISGVYDREMAFSVVFWKNAILSLIRTSMFAAVPYFFSEFIATEIVAIDDREELKKKVEQNEGVMKKNETLEKQNEAIMTENDNLKKVNEERMTENEKLKSENEKLKNENEDAMRKNEKLKSENERVVLANEKLSLSLKEQMIKNDGLEKENDNLSSQKKSLVAENIVLKPFKDVAERCAKALDSINNSYISRGAEHYILKVDINTQKISLPKIASNHADKPKHLIDKLITPPLSNGASKNIPKELIFGGA